MFSDYQAPEVFKKYNLTDKITSLVNNTVSLGLPFAVWRLPFKKEIAFLTSFEQQLKKVKPEIETLPPGFVISPFINENDELLFIPADLVVNVSANEIQLAEQEKSRQKEIDAILNFPKRTSQNFDYYTKESGNEKETTKAEYVEAVKLAVEKINQGEFQKVVPARTKRIKLNKFNLVKYYLRLCEAYPHAFVSIFSSKESGTWITATPELLVTVNKDNIFRTISLAGTQPLKTQADATKAAWKQKEIEEQAMVSRYIINCFKKIRLREYEELGPKTFTAGNVMHLRTDFEVDLKQVDYPQLGSVMLKLLHPTSAVCGMPKEPAIKFIKEHERFSRKFYSGFLGPVQINEPMNIFVNLRSMEIYKNHATLFAAAGITAESIPEKEWQETEIKCNTLLNLLDV